MLYFLIVSIVVSLVSTGFYFAVRGRANNQRRFGVTQESTIRLLRNTLKSERMTMGAQLMASNDAYKLAEERRLGAGRALLKTINEKVATERQLSDANGLIVGLRSERDELFNGRGSARALVLRVQALLVPVKVSPTLREMNYGAPEIAKAVKLIEAERKSW